MKLNVLRNELLLTEVTDEDFNFCNLAGKDTGSIYYNPEHPERTMKLKFTDPEMIQILQSFNANVVEKEDGSNPGSNFYTLKIKAYPRTRLNRITNIEEQLPRITVKDPSTESVRLDVDSFNLVDTAVFKKNVIDISIAFHVFETNYHTMSSGLDELKLVCIDYNDLVKSANAKPRDGYFPDAV